MGGRWRAAKNVQSKVWMGGNIRKVLLKSSSKVLQMYKNKVYSIYNVIGLYTHEIVTKSDMQVDFLSQITKCFE